jgi:hypothetical protein
VSKKSKISLKSNRRGTLRRLFAVRLQHHRHSFKLLPHYHTSYPLLGLLVIITAIFCAGWTEYASGFQVTDTDSYVVTAVVQAPPLTVAATITDPNNGDVLNQANITVTGTCPEKSYVTLSQNGSQVGMATCRSDGSWQIATVLVEGPNTLLVQAYNLTNQAGPTTPAITVTYQPAGPPVTPISPASPDNPYQVPNNEAITNPAAPTIKPTKTTKPFMLNTDFTYQAVMLGTLFDHQVTIRDGIGPYAVHVDWGDGSNNLSSQSATGELNLAHMYMRAGTGQQPYVITVQATDATGTLRQLQLTVVVMPLDGIVGGGITPRNDGMWSGYQQFWRFALPTFVVVLIAITSFWLGQHRELEILRERAIRQHRRRPA